MSAHPQTQSRKRKSRPPRNPTLLSHSFFSSQPHPHNPIPFQASVRPAAAAKADRPLWFPGNPAPAYLDGTLPGDYGFDPLRLGSDPDALKWFQMAEVFHGRVAMVRGRGRGERGAGA